MSDPSTPELVFYTPCQEPTPSDLRPAVEQLIAFLFPESRTP